MSTSSEDWVQPVAQWSNKNMDSRSVAYKTGLYEGEEKNTIHMQMRVMVTVRVKYILLIKRPSLLCLLCNVLCN